MLANCHFLMNNFFTTTQIYLDRQMLICVQRGGEFSWKCSDRITKCSYAVMHQRGWCECWKEVAVYCIVVGS